MAGRRIGPGLKHQARSYRRGAWLRGPRQVDGTHVEPIARGRLKSQLDRVCLTGGGVALPRSQGKAAKHSGESQAVGGAQGGPNYW